eukprot:11884537-Ditylum_brightwellii.AAC.1
MQQSDKEKANALVNDFKLSRIQPTIQSSDVPSDEEGEMMHDAKSRIQHTIQSSDTPSDEEGEMV